ncbi:cerebellin-3-like isoform X2 [Crassostrea angulata]|nr:cerebellin-3-like isoform X2 [Crassostrea angulata]
MFMTCVALLLTVYWGSCEKVSPKPGLKLFREDYKSVEETCLAVGFVRNDCKNNTKKDNRVVAFDVRLKNQKRNLATKARVVFETVDLNEGLGYDASTGVFTAPSGGIYVFDWTILAWQGQIASTSLVVNGQYKSWSYCDDRGSKTWLPCSKMTLVKLKHGDKIWIEVINGTSDIHNLYTSFSGFKM